METNLKKIMQISRRKVLNDIGALATLSLPCGSLFAQGTEYPNKPVKIVVPWPASGATDVVGRLLAHFLAENLKGSFYVENKPGATGLIGTQSVISSPPDGYTLLAMAPSLHAFYASAAAKIPFHPVNDLTPISAFVNISSVLVVSSESKYKDVKDVIGDARKRPGQVMFGSYGNGSSAHMLPELLALRTNTKLTHVPYKGAAPALTDLLAGRIDFMVDSISTPLPYIKSNRLRALAVLNESGSPHLPGVPTLSETVPGMTMVHKIGLGAPPGLPSAIANKLLAAIKAIAKDSSYAEKLFALGLEPAYSNSTAEYKEYMGDQLKKWKGVAAKANILMD